MKEFKPKTRKQLYMNIYANDLENISPDDFPTKRIDLLSDYSIDSWTVASNGYEADIQLPKLDIASETMLFFTEFGRVFMDGELIPRHEDWSERKEDGYKYSWETNEVPADDAIYLHVFAKPGQSTSNLPSTPRVVTMYSDAPYLPDPKTNMEKYFATVVAEKPLVEEMGIPGRYTGPIPEPKTIDEYYTALSLGFTPEDWENSNRPDKPHIPTIGGNIDDGSGAQDGIA